MILAEAEYIGGFVGLSLSLPIVAIGLLASIITSVSALSIRAASFASVGLSWSATLRHCLLTATA